MRWILAACLLGGIGALLKHWHWPYASWISVAGLSLLVIGVFRWLSAFGEGGRRSGRVSDSSAAFDGGGGDIGGVGCDSGGCDGGGD